MDDVVCLWRKSRQPLSDSLSLSLPLTHSLTHFPLSLSLFHESSFLPSHLSFLTPVRSFRIFPLFLLIAHNVMEDIPLQKWKKREKNDEDKKSVKIIRESLHYVNREMSKMGTQERPIQERKKERGVTVTFHFSLLVLLVPLLISLNKRSTQGKQKEVTSRTTVPYVWMYLSLSSKNSLNFFFNSIPFLRTRIRRISKLFP